MYKRITIISVLAIAISACSSSSELTSKYDDIYYSPQDDIPQVEAHHTIKNNSTSPQLEQVLSRDSVLQAQHGTGVASYDMSNMQLMQSDTTANDNSSYVVNNYFANDDMSYSDRIDRFYRGYYDPFWYDDFYYDPYWSMGYYPWYGAGFGWGLGFGFGWGLSWNWGYGPNWGWGGGYYSGGMGNVTYAPRRSSYGITSRSNYTSRSANAYSSRNGRLNSSSRTNTNRMATAQRTSTSSRTTNSHRATILDTRNNSTRIGASTTRSGASTINAANGINRTNINRTGATNVRSSNTARTYTPSYTQTRTINRASYNNSGRGSNGRLGSSNSNYRTNFTKGATYNRASSGSRFNQSYNRTTPVYRTNSNRSTFRSTSMPSRSSMGSFGGGSRSFGGGARGGRR
ncbi:MAG: hypothetical protein ACK5MI_03870 [Mangrovibacterium sp.]